ncbi:RES family NAD+ phosphorylase [Marinicella sp. W31]|uniref:RES family NAD+ phosphorylase n=1 Tax=Marinicella sp. W31 TaxID=3023713 RepID=UPI003757876F
MYSLDDYSSVNLKTKRIMAGTVLFRVYSEEYHQTLGVDAAWYFGKTKDNRFDDPKQEYGVLYCGTSKEPTILETLDHSRFIAKIIDKTQKITFVTDKDLVMRNMAAIVLLDNLRLVDFTGTGYAINDVSFDISNCPRSEAQKYSRKIYENPHGYDGIIYHPRTCPKFESIVLFENRIKKPDLIWDGNLNEDMREECIDILFDHGIGYIPNND